MKKIDELYQEKMVELGFLKQDSCSGRECAEYLDILKKGGKLPDGVFQSPENPNFFFRKEQDSLSKEDMDKLMWLHLFDNVSTIKKCIVFLTAIVAVSLVLSIIIGIGVVSPK